MLSLLKYFRWPALKGKTDLRWSKWSEARQGLCCCFCLFGHKLCLPCSPLCFVSIAGKAGMMGSEAKVRIDWIGNIFNFDMPASHYFIPRKNLYSLLHVAVAHLEWYEGEDTFCDWGVRGGHALAAIVATSSPTEFLSSPWFSPKYFSLQL